MIVATGGKTDKGMVRANNEDNFHVNEGGELLLVADGMGGHASGEVASRLAVEVISDFMENAKRNPELQVGPYLDDYSQTANRVGSAIRLANKAIYDAATSSPQYRGMGTTVVAAVLNDRHLSIAHVGDSRLYLVRAGSIQQLTDDHSLVSEQVKHEMITREEARGSSMKNVLTRAVGVYPEVEVDLDDMTLADGDILVLCTDGLTNMVTDDDIFSIVTGVNDPLVACDQCIRMANENGGEDNITVVVAYVKEKRGWFRSLFTKWFRR